MSTLTSGAPTTAPSRKPASVIKHRACDECRSRKLACSKEPDGCSRCKEEGIPCVYSPQKPMGRPKKRRLISQQPDDQLTAQWNNIEHSAGYVPHPHAMSPAVGLSSLESFDFGYGPLNMAPSLDYSSSVTPPSAPLEPLLEFNPSLMPQPTQPDPFQFLYNSKAEEGPDTHETVLPKENVHSIFEAIGTFIASRRSRGSDNAPSSSDETCTAGSDTEENPHAKAWPSTSCPCLSSVYLSLDSLNNISADIPAAIRVTRNAARVAHQVIQCPACSRPLTEDPFSPPPIQSLQSSMLLCALLTSLANAYRRLFEVVDETVRAAREGGRKLHFSFGELGGVWSQLANGGECLISMAINKSDLAPEVWKLAMRAVLRYEIYGIASATEPGGESSPGCQPTPPPDHLGLIQAVRRMEERSRIRHEKLDNLVAAGHGPTCKHNPKSPVVRDGSEKSEPACMQMLEPARIALDRLAIT